MEYRNLGKSGLKISALSFGSWVTFDNQLKDKSALSCMQMAYERGVNFFDNAEAYANGKSEILMGKVLNKLDNISDMETENQVVSEYEGGNIDIDWEAL